MAATGIYAVLVVAAIFWWMWLGRGTTFLYDEWDFIMAYHQDLGRAIISPHNGQLDAVPVMVYRVMFALLGIHYYWPYRLVGIVFEVGLTSVTFAYLLRRIRPFMALVATVAILGDGQAWQDILWPFEITFTISLAAGVGALILLDRRDKAGELWAAICLGGSVLSCGFGLVFLAGISVEMIWSAVSAGRGLDAGAPALTRRLRRTWVLVPGLVLYLTWYVHDRVGDAVLSWAHDVPAYMAQSAGYGAGSLVGLRGLLAGEVLAALLALVLAARLLLDWRNGARLAMVCMAALSFWALAALARAGVASPDTSRYLQPDGLFVVLALAELATCQWTGRLAASTMKQWGALRAGKGGLAGMGARTKASYPSPKGVAPDTPKVLLAAVVLITTIAVASNSTILAGESGALRATAVLERGDLRAVELAGNNLPFNLQPLPNLAPQIHVGQYLAASAALGSPADSDAQLLAAPGTVRESADALLITALRLAVTATRGHRGARPGAGFVSDRASVSCASSEDRQPLDEAGDLFELKWGRAGLFVAAPPRSSVQVRFRLLSSEFPAQATLTVPAATADIIAPRANLPHLPTLAWWAELKVEGRGTVIACALLA